MCCLTCTGDELQLSSARRFEAFIFTQPLAAGRDNLAQLSFPHANFHLPEVTGLARAYELLSNTTDKAIVDTFFSVLTTNLSYATGGSNSGELLAGTSRLGRLPHGPNRRKLHAVQRAQDCAQFIRGVCGCQIRGFL
jgi:hypothetical protein